MGNSYRELKVWQKATDAVVRVYEMSATWPKAEQFGLISQVRRAAVSIPSNIAEGNGRQTAGESINHLGIAMGSLYEMETQLIIAGKLGFAVEEVVLQELKKTEEIGRMLNGLIEARRRDRNS